MAAKTPSDFDAVVKNLIKAIDDELSQTARYDAVNAALERYSADKPELTTTDVTGDGGKYYDISSASSVLTPFVDGFSRVVKIEYPANEITDDAIPILLDPEDWDDEYWADGVRYLFFPNHAPAGTETARVTYTTPYAFSSNSVTIPTQDFQAICHLAAGLCCEYIAAKYSRTTDSTISADSVDHLSKADQFSRRAQEFIRLYEEHLRLGEEAGPYSGAAEFVDWDTAPGWPIGRDYLFHGRRNR